MTCLGSSCPVLVLHTPALLPPAANIGEVFDGSILMKGTASSSQGGGGRGGDHRDDGKAEGFECPAWHDAHIVTGDFSVVDDERAT